MTAVLNEHTQFVDEGGKPLVNGKAYFGVRNSDPVTNPTPIFSDRALENDLDNPQPLDNDGRTVNKVWLDGRYSIQVNDFLDQQKVQDLDAGTLDTSDLPQGYLNGWQISISGVDPEHDFVMAPGVGQDDTFTFDMQTTSALTKRIDAPWSEGTNGGALDTGTVAVDTTYNVFTIFNPTTSITDFIISTSSSPAFPTGYTAKLRLGTVVTDGSANIFFVTDIESPPVVSPLTHVAGFDTITAEATPTLVSYNDGQFYGLPVFGTSTSTTPTINIGGLGAKTIVKDDNDPLAPGDLSGDTYAVLIFNAAQDVMQLSVYPRDGAALQTQLTQLSAVATTTAQVPLDDTPPLITEGAEFLTLAITPRSATSRLVISVNLFCSVLVESSIIMSLFKDSNTDAIATALLEGESANIVGMIPLVFVDEPGSIAEVTYRIRAGLTAAGTLTINGQSSARLFGASVKSVMTITEYST